MHDIGIGYWFVDTAGVGSIIVLGVGFAVFFAYIAMLRWIQTAPPEQPVAAAKTAENEEATGGAAA
jgi:hypothetical protein